jgi:hypothetical protein
MKNRSQLPRLAPDDFLPADRTNRRKTPIGTLGDAEDYKAFDAGIIADYEAQSAVERELMPALSQSALAAAPGQ